jgi:hypothetical protein
MIHVKNNKIAANVNLWNHNGILIGPPGIF